MQQGEQEQYSSGQGAGRYSLIQEGSSALSTEQEQYRSGRGAGAIVTVVATAVAMV